MAKEYIYVVDKGGKTYGVPDEETFFRLILDDKVTADDSVYCYRRAMWKKAGNLPEVRHLFSPEQLELLADPKKGEASGNEGAPLDSSSLKKPDVRYEYGKDAKADKKHGLSHWLLILISAILLALTVFAAFKCYEYNQLEASNKLSPHDYGHEKILPIIDVKADNFLRVTRPADDLT